MKLANEKGLLDPDSGSKKAHPKPTKDYLSVESVVVVFVVMLVVSLTTFGF